MSSNTWHGLREDLSLRARGLLWPLFWVLLLVYLGGFFSTLLAVFAAVVVASEWHRLTAAQPDDDPMEFAFIAGFTSGLRTSSAARLLLILVPVPILATSGAGLALAWLLAGLAIASSLEWRQQQPRPAPQRLLIRFSGTLWIGLALVAWVLLRGETPRGGLLFWILFVTWATDIAAWGVGKTVGGPLCAPRISPRKTWSGLLGGLGGALIAAALCAPLAGVPVETALRFGLFTGVFVLLGDLAESAVKRYAGVKDSGTFLGGHGGLLDRIDGLLAALVFWLFLSLFIAG